MKKLLIIALLFATSTLAQEGNNNLAELEFSDSKTFNKNDEHTVIGTIGGIVGGAGMIVGTGGLILMPVDIIFDGDFFEYGLSVDLMGYGYIGALFGLAIVLIDENIIYPLLNP